MGLLLVKKIFCSIAKLYSSGRMIVCWLFILLMVKILRQNILLKKASPAPFISQVLPSYTSYDFVYLFSDSLHPDICLTAYIYVKLKISLLYEEITLEQ